MTINFEALKQNRKSSFDKLTSELSKLSQNPNQEGGNKDDDRYWKPDVDKAGNGYAVIRFLPAPTGEDVPFARIWDHGFQGAGGWYIEKSLTTLGQADPVSEYNSKLWNSGIEANKAIVRAQKRRLSYYSNIFVVKDPTRPENEGKVFLFKYGKKIFDKLNDAMHPPAQFEEKPINPFDLWDGANFKLKIRQVDGYRNYDKSEFDKPGPLFADDADLAKNITNIHSLQELIDPKHFKSYNELKAKLEKALGSSTTTASSPVQHEEEEAFQIPQKSAPMKEAPVAAAPWDEDDDDLSFFKKLASE
jgi:hypothetical protein